MRLTTSAIAFSGVVERDFYIESAAKSTYNAGSTIGLRPGTLKAAAGDVQRLDDSSPIAVFAPAAAQRSILGMCLWTIGSGPHFQWYGDSDGRRIR